MEERHPLPGQNVQDVVLASIRSILLKDVDVHGVADGSHHIVSYERQEGKLLLQPGTDLLVPAQRGDDVLLA